MSYVRLKPPKVVNKIVAHQTGVKAAVRGEATKRGAISKAVLAAHRSAGHSEIRVHFGDVDAYIGLHDTRGQQAAAAIEFGREGYTREIMTRNGQVREVYIDATRGVGALDAAMPRGLSGRKRRVGRRR